MIADNYAAGDKTRDQQSDCFEPNSSGMVLVVVVILAAVAGVLAAGLHFASGSRITQVRQEMRFEKAFFVAEAGIERAKDALRYTNLNGVLTNGGVLFRGATNYGEGKFYAWIRNNTNYDHDDPRMNTSDIVIIRSTGIVENATRIVEVEVKVAPFEPLQVDGAVGIYGTNTTLTVQSAAALLDGRDYNLPPKLGDGVKNPSGNPAMPGVIYSSTTTVFDLKPDAVVGTPEKTNGVSTHSETEWAQFVSDNMPPDFYEAGDFMGDRNKPVITMLRPNVTTKLNSGTTGAGVLIVPGNSSLKMNGNFAYEGVVIVYTGGSITVSDDDETGMSGTADIFGAIVCVGGNLNINISGTFHLNYCTQALANLENITSVPAQLTVISWKEIKAPNW